MMADYGKDLQAIRDRVECGLARERERRRGGAAILIPLLPGDEGLDVLFEVRAWHLQKQPGEVCFPGGHIEQGEDPRDAAVRETCEELAISREQVHIIADLGAVDGPGGMPLRVFVGALEGYGGSCDPEEVDRTFTMPLSWFFEHEPRVYRGTLDPNPPDDFPWELVPHGRDYPWRRRAHEIPFYLDSNPLIWGFTARMMSRFVQLLNAGR